MLRYEIGDILKEEVGYNGTQYHLTIDVLDREQHSPKYEFCDIHTGTINIFWCDYVDLNNGFTKVN